MLNIINRSTNQHIKANLNSIIPETNRWIDEVMLYKLGLKVEYVFGQGLIWRDHNKERYKLKGASKGNKYIIQG